MTEKTTSEKVADIIGYFLSLDKEDQEIVLNVQKGVNSRTYVKGRYSVNHEKGVHHFHQLLSKYI